MLKNKAKILAHFGKNFITSLKATDGQEIRSIKSGKAPIVLIDTSTAEKYPADRFHGT